MYSVLMSVYGKDNPEYFNAAIQSVLRQTMKPKEIVVVCDGPLTEALDNVLDYYKAELRVVRLPENKGLGAALAVAINYCNSEWIARMDSDDISAKARCEMQIRYLMEHKDVDVLSGTVAEFYGDSKTEEEAQEKIITYKKVPMHHEDIKTYIKFRNPINHPCVMFRKEKVIEAGNYQTCHLFEDYDLWIRMYQNGCKFANLQEPLLLMRTNGLHARRGGTKYLKFIVSFYTKQYQRGVLSFSEYIYIVMIRAVVCLLPNRLRQTVYERKLRNNI